MNFLLFFRYTICISIYENGGDKYEKINFFRLMKSASSRLIKKEYQDIKKQLWKEFFWSRSYCLLTTGGSPIEIIRKYIENQGR